MTIGTDHLAFIYLGCDLTPVVAAGRQNGHTGKFLSQVIEFEDYRIGLAAIDTGMIEEVLVQEPLHLLLFFGRSAMDLSVVFYLVGAVILLAAG